MEHIVGTECGEDAFHAVAVGNRGDDGIRFNGRIIVSHHQADVVLRSFGLVYQHQFCGMEQTYLPNHLAADTTCRTRDEYLLTFKKVAHTLHVDLYLVARQQVFDANFFQRIHHLTRRIGVPLLHAFGHIDVHASLDKHVLQACVVAKHLVAQGRHQHGIDAVLLNNPEKFVVYLIHFLAHEVMVGKAFLVRDETKEAELLRLLGGNVLCKSHTTLAYAINQCALGLSRVEHRIINTFYHDAESPQQDGGNEIDGNDVPQM